MCQSWIQIQAMHEGLRVETLSCSCQYLNWRQIVAVTNFFTAQIMSLTIYLPFLLDGNGMLMKRPGYNFNLLFTANRINSEDISYNF